MPTSQAGSHVTALEWELGRQGWPVDPEARFSIPMFGPSPAPERAEPVGEREPQAFLVSLGGRNGHLRPHFHPVDQFQVFVDGSARFGRHDVGPGWVHYADAWQPYGPLDPGPEGVTFLTLRITSDSGASYMPDSSPALARRPHPLARRRSTSIPVAPAVTDPPTGCSSLLDEPDGARVECARLPAGGELELGPPSPGGGFIVVLDGDVMTGAGAMGRGSVAWRSPEVSSASLRAGADGAVCLAVGFRASA